MDNRKSLALSLTKKDDLRRFKLAKINRSNSRLQQRGIPRSYTYRLMSESYLTSSSWIDSGNFLIMPVPQGERCLLVSSSRYASLFSVSGKHITDLNISLPEGFELDCISTASTIYVRDIANLSSVPAIDRFQMIQNNLRLVPGLSVLPVYECTQENFVYLKSETELLFFHKQNLYVSGISASVYKWSQQENTDIVNLRCLYDGTLKTLEGRSLYRIPKDLLEQLDLSQNDVLACKVRGVCEWHIHQLEVVGQAFGQNCFSLSQILFCVNGVRPRPEDILDALRDGRSAFHNQELELNSSTASSISDYEEVAFFNNL